MKHLREDGSSIPVKIVSCSPCSSGRNDETRRRGPFTTPPTHIMWYGARHE